MIRTQSVSLFTPTHAPYADTGAGAGAVRILIWMLRAEHPEGAHVEFTI